MEEEEEQEARAPACGWEKLCQECKPSAGRCARSCCCCRRLLPSIPGPGSGRAERRPAKGKHVRGGGVGGCRGSRAGGSHAALSGLGVPEASESALGRLEPGPPKSLRISVTLGQAPRAAPSVFSSAVPGETHPSRAPAESSGRCASKRRESWRTDGERLRSGRGCAGVAGGPDASLDTRREGWPETAAAGRHEARRRSPGVSVAPSLGPGPPLHRSSSLNETLRYSGGRGAPSAMVAALTPGGLASGTAANPPLRPRPVEAQPPGSEGRSPAAAVAGVFGKRTPETGAELYLLRLKFLRPRAASASSRAAPPASVPTLRPGPNLGRCSPEHCARPGRARSGSLPQLCARQPGACLPPLALPLQLLFPPSCLLDPRSLLLQINFVAGERGRGAGPQAPKRGWAPRAR